MRNLWRKLKNHEWTLADGFLLSFAGFVMVAIIGTLLGGPHD